MAETYDAFVGAFIITFVFALVVIVSVRMLKRFFVLAATPEAQRESSTLVTYTHPVGAYECVEAFPAGAFVCDGCGAHNYFPLVAVDKLAGTVYIYPQLVTCSQCRATYAPITRDTLITCEED